MAAGHERHGGGRLQEFESRGHVCRAVLQQKGSGLGIGHVSLKINAFGHQRTQGGRVGRGGSVAAVRCAAGGEQGLYRRAPPFREERGGNKPLSVEFYMYLSHGKRRVAEFGKRALLRCLLRRLRRCVFGLKFLLNGSACLVAQVEGIAARRFA